MKKRVTSILLLACLLAGSTGYTAIAEEGEKATSFSNDFEGYIDGDGAARYGEFYFYSQENEEKNSIAAQNNIPKRYINNGATYKGNASYSTLIPEGELYINQYDKDGNLQKPVYGGNMTDRGLFLSNTDPNTYSSDALILYEDEMSTPYAGGLEGYAGIAGRFQYHAERSKTGGAHIDDMQVVNDPTDSSNDVLCMCPEDKASLFGKNNVDLTGLSEINARIYINKYDGGTYSSTALTLLKNTFFEDFKQRLTLHFNKQVSAWNEGVAPYSPSREGYDVLIMNGGKIYLGYIDDAHYVCDYSEKIWYNVKYYLNLQNPSEPKHAVIIEDDAGNVLGSKALDLAIDGNKYPIVSSNINKFTGFANVADDTMGIFVTRHNQYGYSNQQIYLDDFSFSKLNSLEINTGENEYINNPLDIVNGEVNLEFNYPLQNNSANDETVLITSQSGEKIDADFQVNKNNLKIKFGTLEEAQHYRICFTEKFLSALNIGFDGLKTLDFETKQPLSVTEASMNGKDLSCKIKNNSNKDYKGMIIASVYKDGIHLTGVKYKLIKLGADEISNYLISDVLKNTEGNYKVRINVLSDFLSAKPMSYEKEVQ